MAKGDPCRIEGCKGVVTQERSKKCYRCSRNVARIAEIRTARYRYVRDVLKEPAWKARIAMHTVLALRAMYPHHEFPEELVVRRRAGPKPRLTKA